MLKVFKYPLAITDRQKIHLPRGARILSFQSPRGQPFIWALVDPEATAWISRRFRLVGTGHPIEDTGGLSYIGTVVMWEGALVWHLFEIVMP